MSSTDKAYLCVGGPWNGRRRLVTGGQLGFTVSCLHDLPMPQGPFGAEVRDAVHIDTVTYLAEMIYDTWFWRPVTQTREETVRLLFASYERAANINWEGSPFAELRAP